MQTEVICPTCGKTAEATETRFGVRHDCCGLRSWGGKPLVSPATMDARRKAHAAFDPIWQHKLISRGRAYKELAKELNMSRRDCHISLMNEQDALRVPAAAKKIRERVVKQLAGLE